MSRRIVIAGGGTTVVVGAVVALQRTGTLGDLIAGSGLPPAREPDKDDTAILNAARRRQTELLDLAARRDSDIVTQTLRSGLNSLGGRASGASDTATDASAKPETEQLMAALQDASDASADDAVKAHSSALIRTLASLSAGLAQLATVVERDDE